MNSFKSAFGLGGSNSKTSLAGWEAIAQTEGPVPDPHASLESGHAPTGDNNSSSGGENNGGLVQKAWRSITSSLPQFPEFSYLQRMIGFTLFFGAGALMIALCIFNLPSLLLGGAAKFTLSYALANLFIVSSSCFIVSPDKQAQTLFSAERYRTTIAYFGSMFLTIFVCIAHPTVFFVLPCLIVQFGALIWYICSYSPCGTSALNSVASQVVASTMLPKVFGGSV